METTIRTLTAALLVGTLISSIGTTVVQAQSSFGSSSAVSSPSYSDQLSRSLEKAYEVNYVGTGFVLNDATEPLAEKLLHRALDGQINFVGDFYREDDDTASLYPKIYRLTPEESASDLRILNSYSDNEDWDPSRYYANIGVPVSKDREYYYVAIVENDLGPR